MSTDQGNPAKAQVIPLKAKKCPICKKTASFEFRPFCSKRCANLDLGRWLDGDYRLPTDEASSDADVGTEDDDINT